MNKEWKPRTWEEAIDRENMLVWLQSPKTTTFAILDRLTGHPDYACEFNRKWVERYDKHPGVRPVSIRQIAIETVEGKQ